MLDINSYGSNGRNNFTRFHFACVRASCDRKSNTIYISYIIKKISYFYCYFQTFSLSTNDILNS